MQLLLADHEFAFGWRDLRTAEAGDPPPHDAQPGRLRSNAARRLLCRLAAHLLKTDIQAVEIVSDAQRRPWVVMRDSGRRFHASLAHSRDIVAAAIDLRGPVGVDVEFQGRPRDYRAIARRIFSEDIACRLATTEQFYRCWCLYEAWIKTYGTGKAARDVDAGLLGLVETLLEPDRASTQAHPAVVFPYVSRDYAACLLRDHRLSDYL